MSSYFDNQYGGEDEDNKFGGDSDNESSSTSEEEEELEGEVEDEVEGDVEEELDDDDIDDDDDTQIGGDIDDGDIDNGDIDDDIDQTEKETEKKNKKTKKIPAKTPYKKPDYMDDEDDDENNDEDGELYLQKFDHSINSNYVVDFHPESVLQNYDEILSMIKVIRDKDDIIIDNLHRTIPYLTKYEKARILGQRAKQINSGATAFVKVPENVIDGYVIAELELKEKKIPFIIRRPLPNGGSEYWSIKDLEDISF